MHHGFVRVAAASPVLRVADVPANVERTIALLDLAQSQDARVVVCPEMGLTGYTCNDLFFQKTLLEAAAEGLIEIARATGHRFDGLALVGLPVFVDDQVFNCAAAVAGGKVLGIVPKTYLPNYKEFYDARFFAASTTACSKTVRLGGQEVPFGTDLLFAAVDVEGLIVGVEICEDLWVPVPPSSIQCYHGATILTNLSASNETIGKAAYRRQLVGNQSARCIAGYVYSSAGVGESSTDLVFGGHCLIAENGALLAESQRFQRDQVFLAADVDLDRLRTYRAQTTSFNDAVLDASLKREFRRIEFRAGQGNGGPALMRTVEAHPFVPSVASELRERCEEIFLTQLSGLASRLEFLGKPAVAIGVSGGLDSTLALLVLCKTFDALGVGRDKIRALTMPGFGTTPRTRSNAVGLMNALGVRFREIDIRPMCFAEMKSLGHAPFGIKVDGLDLDAFCARLRSLAAEDRCDLTFENIQARARTSLLMNTGFVIGTGDLSELALGWCTYNADHMSMYNPNMSIPKTLVKFLVEWAAENEFEGETRQTLLEIVKTPISPELLPSDGDGNAQSTEAAIGPYELHDFFLYHFLRFGSPPSKILFLAGQAKFDRPYESAEIRQWLGVFLRRFFANQYKRSCLPDGPKVGSVSLSPRGGLAHAERCAGGDLVEGTGGGVIEPQRGQSELAWASLLLTRGLHPWLLNAAPLGLRKAHSFPMRIPPMRMTFSLLVLLGILSDILAQDSNPPFYADKSNLLVYLDAGGKPVPIKSAADWLKRREHILANMQQVMGTLPPASRKVPLDLKVESEEPLAKVIRKKITFAVEKDDRVSAYLLIPKEIGKSKLPAMLCLHQTTRIGKGEPAGVGGLPNLHYALELAERGYVTLAPDYPNFGDYKVDAYAKNYVSATMKGIWNHMRAVDLLQSLPQVDGERIGVIGHSLGGHNSLFVAAFDPRLKVAVTSCGFNSFLKYDQGNLTGWSHKGYMPRIASEFNREAAKMPFDFTEILGSIAPRAVFINAPLHDDNFEVSGVRDCVTAAGPVYRLLEAADNLEAVYPDAQHDFPPATRLQAYAFIDRHLRPRVEFTRLIAHWAEYGDDDYLKFVEDAKPEICQVGFYGGHFWSLAHTPQFGGYPAHFPVQGLAECGRWFEKRNSDIHQRGARVVGHFNTTFLVGEPEGKTGPRGFFKFYKELWDEKELGPKPVADPLALLAKNADGTPMASTQYSIGQMREFTACLNNPHWRAVLKAWAKRGIERGVDGFMINYFYRHNCLCEHCQSGFRSYLGEQFTPEQVRERFAIADLKGHQFTELVGWHDPKQSTPLRREMLRWSQISCKRAFDEVFVQYARSLKPGLVLGQWDHLGDFNQINGDERCMLPGNLWGRDEDYLWYSTGAAAFFTDLAEGFLGDATLQARYIRGAFDNKPYTLGKYESTRTRTSIAELAANGGAPMGFYTPFKNEMARQEMVRYYRFLEKHDALYRGNRSHAEVVLLYPRSKVHEGQLEALDAFKELGKKLLDQHVLFDVLPDDRITSAQRASYRAVLEPGTPLPAGLSQFKAPMTVRVSASRPKTGREITLHFVNYNREEPKMKKSAGAGIKDEKPIAVEGVEVDLALPKGANVTGLTVFSPEEPDETHVKFGINEGRIQFTMPKFLVYGVARLQLAKD